MRMTIQQFIFGRRLILSAVLLFFFGTGTPCVAGPSGEQDIDQVATFDEMASVLSTLTDRLSAEMENDAPAYDVQKEILTRAGECISRLAYLCRLNSNNRDKVQDSGKTLFSANREIIRKILTTNEKTILRFQEEVLDTIADPMAFFQTPRWQHPQQLISLSSYWLGWNGYYASLVLTEDDPVRRQMLTEGIDGFSRAFVDFEEKDVIAKSLYGRGLCYKQLNAFQNALYDFKAVKDRIKDDDLLLARCLLEEAIISYETRNLTITSGKLDRIEELFGKNGVPDNMAASMAELRANVLLARIEKKSGMSDETGDGFDDAFLATFRDMKQLAVNRGRINESFYRYVQSHVDGLETLSYSELGPVAAMAIGDKYYSGETYEKALPFYREVLADPDPAFSQDMDRLTYRTAVIYFKNGQWQETVGLMESFHDAFPQTAMGKQAASLYYSAATNRYKESKESDTYDTYIDAVQSYLAYCDDCSGRSEAHFQLGLYFRDNGKSELANAAFSAVEKDSPDFFQAKYYLLETCVKKLDLLSEQGLADTEEKMGTYHDGLKIIDDCRQTGTGEKSAGNREALAPFMAILQGRFYLHGESDAWETGYRLLGDFQEHYPTETSLFADAAKLRIEYCVLLGKEETFETELNAMTGTGSVSPTQYAALHDLANRFFSSSKKSDTDRALRMSSPYALAALAIYEKLHAVSEKNASYGTYIQSIELRMAQICMKEKRIDRAEALYTDILRENPKSADAVYGLGLIYEQKEQWQKALQTWREFSDGVEAGTYHWFQSRYRTAIALHNLGETDRACTVITMTRVLHPDFSDDDLAAEFQEFEENFCKGEIKK